MEDIVFKPKYGFFRVHLGFVFAFIIGIIVAITTLGNLGYLAFGSILCFAGVFGSRSYPREILFQQHNVVVKSWLFPQKIVDYNDINNVNGVAMVFGGFGSVSLFNMKNSEKSIKTINLFSKEQESLSVKPQETQIAVLRSSRIKMMSAIYIPIALIVFLSVFIGYFGIFIDLRLITVGATLIVIVATLFISRRKPK